MIEDPTQYINPNFPVYFSYAGNNDASECDLEASVKQLRELFDREHIYYLDYQVEGRSAFEPGKTYAKSEEEIGNGEFIVVVLSDKYINLNYNGKTTLHCMYEWHCIVSRKDFKNHIFTFLAKGDNIKQTLNPEKDILKNVKASYDEKYDAISLNYWKKGSLDNELEDKFYKAGKDAFKNDLDKMSSLVRNAPTFDKAGLELVVEQIKARIAELEAPNQISVGEMPIVSSSYRIKSNYFKPLNKKFCGREKFKNDLHDDFASGTNMLNVYGIGGVGKTSVAHIYIRDYEKEYDKILFLTSNEDFEKDFCDEIEKDCLTRPIDWKRIGMQIGYDKKIEHIVNEILCQESPCDAKKNLLVFDVNIVDSRKFKNVHFYETLSKLCDTWHILLLSRIKMKCRNLVYPEKLPHFDEDFDGAKELFLDVYERKSEQKLKCPFSDEDLKALFTCVYHHPLLIEQLAVFAVTPFVKTLTDLKEAVTLDDKREFVEQTLDEEGIVLEKKKDEIITIYDYLKKLISFNYFKDLDKDKDRPEAYCILQHFMLWPYEYIPLSTISRLLRGVYSQKSIIKGLGDLVDKVVLSENGKQKFRMHGALAEALRNELYDENSNITQFERFVSDGVYDNYISNIESLTGKEDKITKQCVAMSLSHYLLRDSAFRIYQNDKYFSNVGEQLGWEYNTGVCELAYKIKLLKELFDYSAEEIYDKINSEYKDISSHLIYQQWLVHQTNNIGNYTEQVKDGVVFISIPVNGVDIKMIKVEGGIYQMGGYGFGNEQPIHDVFVDTFYICETQVPQGLWRAVMKKESPSDFQKGDDYPVESVSWFQCMEFIRRLNEELGLQFRLPTEAEWEYAARGGKNTHGYEFSGSEKVEEVAWYGYFDRADKRRTITTMTTMPVKHKKMKPNELGLYDMSGNVWEWCQDWYAADYYQQCVNNPDLCNNPQGPASGASRVLRGGSWYYFADNCRVSYRGNFAPDDRSRDNGFRLLLSSPKKEGKK